MRSSLTTGRELSQPTRDIASQRETGKCEGGNSKGSLAQKSSYRQAHSLLLVATVRQRPPLYYLPGPILTKHILISRLPMKNLYFISTITRECNLRPEDSKTRASIYLMQRTVVPCAIRYKGIYIYDNRYNILVARHSSKATCNVTSTDVLYKTYIKIM